MPAPSIVCVCQEGRRPARFVTEHEEAESGRTSNHIEAAADDLSTIAFGDPLANFDATNRYRSGLHKRNDHNTRATGRTHTKEPCAAGHDRSGRSFVLPDRSDGVAAVFVGAVVVRGRIEVGVVVAFP